MIAPSGLLFWDESTTATGRSSFTHEIDVLFVPFVVSSSRSSRFEGGTMWKFVALTLVLAAVTLVAQQPAAPSPWAYGFDGPAATTAAPAVPPGGRGGQAGRGGGAAPAPDTTLHQLPGST